MKKSEKYQGSWKNHVKAGQEKTTKILLPTSDFRRGATDRDQFDGFGILDVDPEYSKNKYAKYLAILRKM